MEEIMKKAVLFALMLAAALSAHAATYHTPTWGADYTCTYTNPPYPSVDGISTFVLTSTQYDAQGRPIYRAIEYYDASYGPENRKVTFAKPVNRYIGTTLLNTTWEFTILNGPQCKQTDIYGWGKTIYFNDCTDGHTRRCDRLY
jgi:hypothetical protein